MTQEKEYFAFISYQRKDEEWADRLRNKLEHYRLPSSLRKQDASLPKEIRPIFRDALELAGGVLAKEIEIALQNSKYLIVICSPNSAKSPWVNKEIQTFIDLGREDRIIPFVIDGIPSSDNDETECFPPALRSLKGEKELLGININELSRDAASIKVVARMFGLKFDTLWQRYEREKKRKRWMIIGGALLFAFVSLGIGGYIAKQNRELDSKNREIRKERDRANTEKRRAERTSDSLVIALDNIKQQNTLIQQQRNDLNISNRRLQLSNAQLAKEKQTALTQYARLLAVRAEEHIKEKDYLTARRILLEVLSQDGTSSHYPYVPEVEQALRKSYENNSCIIKAHINNISDVIISPNGKYVVSCASNEDVKIWDTQTGLLIDSVPNNEYMIGIKFSPDGYLFIQSDSIRVWNLGPLRKIASYNKSSIMDIDSRNRLLSVVERSKHQYVVILDGMTGRQLNTIPIGNNRKHITSAIFLSDNRIATASLNDSIQIWDINTKSLVKGWKAHTCGVNFMHASSDGNFLLSGEFGQLSVYNGIVANDSLIIWDANSGMVISKYPYYVKDAFFSPDNKSVIARTRKNNEIVIIDVSSGKVMKTINGHNTDITKIDMDKKGRLLVSASASNGIIRLWDENLSWSMLNRQASNKNYNIPVAMNPNGHSFLMSTGDTIIAFTTTNSLKVIKKFGKNTSSDIKSIRFGKDGSRFIITDASATLWDALNYTPICIIRSFKPAYAEISPGGSKALTVQGRNAICVWDISKGDSIVSKHLVAFKSGTENNRVNMASFSPNGKYIVTANSDGIIRIWDVNSQTCVDSLIGHKGSVNTAYYNFQGNNIVSASSDRTIRIWNTKTRKSKTLVGHDVEVSFAEFSSDGKYVISTSFDNTCKIWDVQTGIVLKSDFSNSSWSAIDSNTGKYITTDYPRGVTLNTFPTFQELVKRVKTLYNY